MNCYFFYDEFGIKNDLKIASLNKKFIYPDLFIQNDEMTSGADQNLQKSLKKAYSELIERGHLYKRLNDNNNDLNTVDCIDLEKNEIKKLNAQYFYAITTKNNEKKIPLDSTGLATHTNLTMALNNALLELVEKNNIILGFNFKNINSIKYLSENLYIIDVSFIYPFKTKIAIQINKDVSSKLFYWIGAGCSLSDSEAEEKALAELTQLGTCLELLLKNNIKFSKHSYTNYYIERNNKDNFYEDWGYIFKDESLLLGVHPPEYCNNNEISDLFIKYNGKLYLHIYENKSNSNLKTVKTVSERLINHLIPHYWKSEIKLHNSNIKFRPIPFP